MNFNFSKNASWIDSLMNMAMAYLPKALLAIVVLFLGSKIISLIVKALGRFLDSRNVDSSLKSFAQSLAGMMLKVVLFISVAGMVGIETTSFVAVLGAAGLAVGMALQGTLGNFAGGALIMIFKPFKVGDFIEAMGHSGVVKEIQIFCTILQTGDRKTIILPNGALSGGSMVNYSTQPIRRVDLVFGIGYGDDLKKAKSILEEIANADSRVLKDEGITVVVGELADSSVNFNFRVHVKSADYWAVYSDMLEKVKLTFDEQGISIPFPQQDVHMHQVQ